VVFYLILIVCFVLQASYETQENIQLMRFADYFGRAFANVSAAQFPWAKMFKESTMAKMVEVSYWFAICSLTLCI
jgi:succinate-acetate transporter protein